MEITRRTLAAYREHGFEHLGQVLDRAALHEVCAAVEAWALEREPGPYGVLQNNLWLELPSVAALIEDGRLAAVAGALLGSSEIVLFQDNLVWKPPGAARIEWHQDFSYWPLDAATGVTLWLALDDADPDNGCLHYVPGTHRRGECQPADFIAGTGQPPRPGLPKLDWQSRASDAVAASARAGDLLAHDPLVWHMSPANSSTRHRRAVTFTWIGADVRWDPDHAPHPFNHRLRPAPGAQVRGAQFPCFVRASGPVKALETWIPSPTIEEQPAPS